jgi:hypothetical protein
VCAQFVVGLAAQVQKLEERLNLPEAQARQDSRRSSRPPFDGSPKTRVHRRAEARAKAKKLMRREGGRRGAGEQPGIAVLVASCDPGIRWMRLSITIRRRVAGASRVHRRGAPAQAAIRSGFIGRRLTFVALGMITVGPDDLQVAVTKKQVKTAPTRSSLTRVSATSVGRTQPAWAARQ